MLGMFAPERAVAGSSLCSGWFYCVLVVSPRFVGESLNHENTVTY